MLQKGIFHTNVKFETYCKKKKTQKTKTKQKNQATLN